MESIETLASATSERPRPMLLLVDDCNADLALMQLVLRKLSPGIVIETATSGHEALAYLRNDARQAGHNFPMLMILDLNMPQLNGIEVLKIMRADPSLEAIPVIMMTSSADEQDVRCAYAAHANAYVQKPRQIDGLRTVLNQLLQFWLGAAVLPPAPTVRR